MLEAPLAGGRVIACPGSGRLWVLNASASAIWDLRAGGLAADAMARLLAERFGLAVAALRTDIDDLLRDWRASGLLPVPAAVAPPPERSPWVIPPLYAPPPPAALSVSLAGLPFSLLVADPALHGRLAPLLRHLALPAPERVAHHLCLAGSAGGWNLALDGQPLKDGQGADAALVAVLHTLVDLACRAEDRLLIVHGAGLGMDDGRGLLLVAPGGSGKTTLAAALNAEGLRLLSDDVVPVRLDGHLLALGAPLCLKPGSWPVLARHRPDLAAAPDVERFGQTIRYLPPLGPPPATLIAPGLLLFPRYQPGAAARLSALTPEAALQGIVEAEAVIRNLTQDKLNRLARWVSAIPAYALTYPDLQSGLTAVTRCLARDARPTGDGRP